MRYAAEEFDRQVDNLVSRGYPALADETLKVFLNRIKPLKSKVLELTFSKADLERGRLPFLLVVKSEIVPTKKAMELSNWHGKKGVTKLYPRKPEDFVPIEDLAMPRSAVYLLIDIDRGKNNINLPPNAAMKRIKKAKRSPLTIDEGVAATIHYPEFLRKNNCYSLLASRYSGDKRVPAIWINADKRANLGWCWDGNPHKWLGSASCRERFG